MLLDPTRHGTYAMLVSVYAMAGVPGATPLIGISRAPSSFADLMSLVQQRENVRLYNAVLRDTIILVPAESLSAIPKDSLNEWRREARSVARSWGERWLGVATGEAAPHQVMSELYALDGDYAAALRDRCANAGVVSRRDAVALPGPLRRLRGRKPHRGLVDERRLLRGVRESPGVQ
jgi:hypothetical protein